MDEKNKPDPDQIAKEILASEEVRDTVLDMVTSGLNALQDILSSPNAEKLIDGLRKKGLNNDHSQQ